MWQANAKAAHCPCEREAAEAVRAGITPAGDANENETASEGGRAAIESRQSSRYPRTARLCGANRAMRPHAPLLYSRGSRMRAGAMHNATNTPASTRLCGQVWKKQNAPHHTGVSARYHRSAPLACVLGEGGGGEGGKGARGVCV